MVIMGRVINVEHTGMYVSVCTGRYVDARHTPILIEITVHDSSAPNDAELCVCVCVCVCVFFIYYFFLPIFDLEGIAARPQISVNLTSLTSDALINI